MKIISDLAKRVVAAITEKAAPPPASAFISRPVLNAQKWLDWAAKWGVPNLVPADQMHVTVLYSTTELKAPLVETAINVSAQRGVFAFFGQDEDCLVFSFSQWELWERNWELRDAGASTTWSSYRPHLTLSYDATGYELPDAAMQDVPGVIVLGGETLVTTKAADPSDVVDADDSLVEVVDIIVLKAAELLQAQGETMPLLAAYDLAEVAKGRTSRAVAKRLADADWAPDELKSIMQPKSSPVRKRVEAAYMVEVRQLPEDIRKKLKSSEVAKANDEDQVVYGIASVSTVNGELVKDLQGDEVTTRALVEFNRSLIGGSRAGKFYHEGDVCTEVVAGIVLTEDWQKALGIDLECEPYLVEIHVPGPDDWAEVKQGDWMLSIAGTMWHWEDEAADAEV